MRRFPALTLVMVFIAMGFTACGNDSKRSAAASLKLSSGGANFLSLRRGQFGSFTVEAFDDKGAATELPLNITWSASGPATVSTAGLVCGGTWDSVTTPLVCQSGAVG